MISKEKQQLADELSAEGQWFKALYELGGYYQCPKDENGKRLGPLVGYAGRYGSDNKQYVGDVFVNFAKVEEYTPVLYNVADKLLEVIPKSLGGGIDVFCGMPMGGIGIALTLGVLDNKRFVYMEKKITSLATDTSREVSKLVWGRHNITAGDNVVIVEDVCNNFSTTSSAIDLVLQEGGEVVAIVCFLNRSMVVGDEYLRIPVIPLVRDPMPEWRQEDPEVADDIANGNVIWKPKERDNWAKLMAVMEANS